MKSCWDVDEAECSCLVLGNEFWIVCMYGEFTNCILYMAVEFILVVCLVRVQCGSNDSYCIRILG